MWEQLMGWLANGGSSEAIAGALAGQADPGTFGTLLGNMPEVPPEAMLGSPTAMNPPAPPSYGPNPNSMVPGNIGTPGAMMPGVAPHLGLNLAQPMGPVPMPEVMNPPSYNAIVNGGVPAATSDAAFVQNATPDPTKTRPSMGLTPEQSMALMKGMGGQEQQQRMPAAPAVSGQAARPPGAATFGGLTGFQRPPTLGALLAGRR
jgi:hypothetical protein